MIGEYAMGTGFTSQRVVSGADDAEVSERTRRLRDEEQQDLSDEARRQAMRVILGHRDRLDALATSLLRNEVLERAEIDRIMRDVPPSNGRQAAGALDVAAAVALRPPGLGDDPARGGTPDHR